MKRLYMTILLTICTIMVTWGQKLSDSEILSIAVQEKKSGASEADIAAKLMQKGATIEQIQRIRQQYAKQITNRGLDNSVDNAIGNVQERMRVNNEVADNEIVTHEDANAPDYVPEAL